MKKVIVLICVSISFLVILFFKSDIVNYFKQKNLNKEFASTVSFFNSISNSFIDIEIDKLDFWSLSDLENDSIANCDDCIFFRYSELSCKVCIDNSFEIINKILKKNDVLKKVRVLVNYNSPRILEAMVEKNNVEDIIFINTNGYSVINDLDEMQIPYFFTVDENYKINSSLIIINELPHRTETYLDTYKNLFNKR